MGCLKNSLENIKFVPGELVRESLRCCNDHGSFACAVSREKMKNLLSKITKLVSEELNEKRNTMRRSLQ